MNFSDRARLPSNGSSADRGMDSVRRRVFLATALSCIPACVAFGLHAWFGGYRFLAALEWSMAAAAAGVFAAARRHPSAVSPRFVLVAALAVFFFYLFASGGVARSGPYWSVLVPLGCTFMLGLRRGSLVSAAYLFACAAWMAASLSSAPELAPLPLPSALRLAATFAVVFILSAAYEISQTRARMSLCAEVDARRRMELELQQANLSLTDATQKANAANQAKSEFLANMSHEIRTPLNAIVGFAQILENDPSLGPRQAEQARTIAGSSRHLLDLVNDLLDMSKIEAGRLSLAPSAFLLGDLLDEIESTFRARAEGKNLRFSFDRSDSLPVAISADVAKLRQIWSNLLGNAVKFTRSGRVVARIRSEPLPADPESVLLVAEVEDTGPGIPHEDLPGIFDAFRQSAAGREAGGTGLGLAITDRLLSLMGGSIDVESMPGIGCRFRFRLPVRRARDADAHKSSGNLRVRHLATGHPPVRVLAVDDQKANRLLLRDVLEPAGFEVRLAANGLDAISAFAEWHPHAVLMDLRMPGMDGYETIRRIQSLPNGASVPIVAVTASVFGDDSGQIQSCGAAAVVRKPFHAEDVFGALQSILDLRFVYHRDSPAASAPSPLPDDLARIPGDLRLDMAQAVESGDMDRLRGAIDRLAPDFPALALGLGYLARQYDYETIARLLANSGGPAQKDDAP